MSRFLAISKYLSLRKNKQIGKALEAEVNLEASGELLTLLTKYAESLKEALNVSAVRVTEGKELKAKVIAAQGTKCNRCWNFTNDTANYGAWENLCGRCRSALEEMKIPPPTAEQIAAAAAEPKPTKKEAAK